MLPLKSLYRNLPSSFLYSIKLFPLRWINSVSLSLLLFLSPAYGAFWLLIVTLYLLFKGYYKNIFIIWGLFFVIWYLFFIVFFLDYESQILIGGEHTLKVMMYLCDKYSIYRAPWHIKPFEGFCFQTVIMLNSLSAKLGFPIYIPSVLAGLKAFISF